jgi:hypothetical protein
LYSLVVGVLDFHADVHRFEACLHQPSAIGGASIGWCCTNYCKMTYILSVWICQLFVRLQDAVTTYNVLQSVFGALLTVFIAAVSAALLVDTHTTGSRVRGLKQNDIGLT